MYWLPKTKIGKWSFWMTMLGLLLMYIPYWISIIFGVGNYFSGFLSIAFLVIFGISSIVSITRFKDKAILLFFSSLLGLLGIIMILGELIFQH